MTSVPLPEAPKGSSLLAKWAALGRWATIVITSALLLTVCESIFLAPSVLEKEGTAGTLTLSALLLGNWLPYAAFGASLLIAVEVGVRWLLARSRSPLWIAVAFAVLILPYAAWLAHYTMSGPNVGSHPLRRVGIVSLTALIAIGFGVITALVSHRQGQARFSPAVFALSCALAGGALWLSGVYLPNEYEPLHAGLGYFAVLAAVIGAGELSLERRFPQTKKFTLALCFAVAVGSLASGWILAESNRWAWLVWGETPGSRYVTARFTWEEEDTEALKGSPETLRPFNQDGRLNPGRRERPAPHIFVFSIDNLQPNHVGAYGYDKRPSTPHIDDLAKEGTLFRRAYSYQPQTRVFMTSMLLGRRISDFGAHDFPTSMRASSLTRLLKERDYFTLVKGVFELTKHHKFKPSDYLIDTNIERESAEVIRKARRVPHIPYAERFRIVKGHLEKARGRPVFVWVHLLGPHWFGGSFSPSEDFPFGNSVEAKYDSAIAGTDQWLGRLQQMAREHLGEERDIYWIVMSDHGAGLTEGKAKRESGKSILERHVHVPLIIAGPGIQTGDVDVPVDAALDTAATILHLAGIDQPPGYDGVSLVPVLEGQTVPQILSERVIPLRNRAWTGAVYGQWKYVNYRKTDRLFDLSKDPGEKKNLADEHPKLVRRLRTSSKKLLKAAEKSRRSKDEGEEE